MGIQSIDLLVLLVGPLASHPDRETFNSLAILETPVIRLLLMHQLEARYFRCMAKFLVIYNGAAQHPEKNELSEDQQTEFLNAWASWAQTHRLALIDPGSPLYRKKRVTVNGIEDFTDSKTGYAIVETASHDEAVHIFSTHPHLGLIPGNSIDVFECPPAPGQFD